MNHEEFAERAERRLKEVADRLEVEGKDLRIAGEASKITARAQELRVAALLVREERRELAQACFDFLPARCRLDMLGYEAPDIFSH